MYCMVQSAVSSIALLEVIWSQGPVSHCLPCVAHQKPHILQVWTKQSQEHVLEIEPFSPNAQVAALNCATRHDPSHYHKLAEELLAARECLREMGCGVYQELHQELQHQLESAAPVLLADVERGAAPAKLKCPCVLNHRVRTSLPATAP